MKDKDIQIIRKITKRIESTLSYCEGASLEDFTSNTMLQEACVFNLLQIGEAANHLSDEFKTRFTNIPWHQIIGLRNRLVHDYDGIRLVIVWETIQNDFPGLKKQLEQITLD